MTPMSWLLVASVALLVYVYGLYPALLRLIVLVRGARAVRRQKITPPVSLVISAFNEAADIRAKLDNALALDYPRRAVEIVVISDASSDGTDDIVRAYADRGVKLLRQPERHGKTAGLNRFVPTLSGDIVVFSDANAMYERDALRKLVRNFADPDVGCVTGEARYLPIGHAAADVGERVYWNYEIHIKRLETAVGSMVGGDGAIYAIRRHLWRELPDNAINDFLNPLQIVAAGWRAVYEPEAICYEETAGGIGVEYRRRVRIVSRSWRAVFQARATLNPLRVGLFAWCLTSHKLLRWLSPAFAAGAAIALLVLLADVVARRPVISAAAAVTAALCLAGTKAGRRQAAVLAYFVAIASASAVGVLKGSLGRVSGIWTPPRGFETAPQTAGRLLPVGRMYLMAVALLACAVMGSLVTLPAATSAALLFWGAVATLVYVYALYPALLFVMRARSERDTAGVSGSPTVSLLVAANDEASVIESKLRNSLALDYPADRLEIVVASDGSQDDTDVIVRRFAPRVKLLAFARRSGKIATINQAMRAITSDIVVFSDANTFLEPGALRAMINRFSDPRVGAVSGDVVLLGYRAALARSEDLYYAYERRVQHAESESGSMVGADGALYAIRRELFVPPPDDTILDDMAIPMAVVRSGHRVVFEPAARAYEQGSDTAWEEFARKSRVIAGAVQFMRRPDSAVPVRAPQVIFALISHKALRWLSPVFATCAFVASMTLADQSNIYALAAAAQGALIALGIAGCVPALRRIPLIAVAHYFCLLQAAAAIGFLRGITGRQSVLWRRFTRLSTAEPVERSRPEAETTALAGTFVTDRAGLP
jgi:cellulose synthase/poly-beta-1,6-N-acetylglucosamine synthase-like glycosyltransferase